MPALGAVLALVLLRIKKRHVKSRLHLPAPAHLSHEHPSVIAESNMPTEDELDAEIALRKSTNLLTRTETLAMSIGIKSDISFGEQPACKH